MELIVNPTREIKSRLNLVLDAKLSVIVAFFSSFMLLEFPLMLSLPTLLNTM